MMSMVQSLLVQQSQDIQAPNAADATLPMKKMTEAPQNAEPRSVAVALQELVEIHREIARVEKMTADVEGGEPEAEEARKWYEVSLRALQWSRSMLDEKQAKCLAEIAQLTGSQIPSSLTSASPDGRKASLPEPSAELSPESKECAPAHTSTWSNWSTQDIRTCEEFVPGKLPVVPALIGGSLKMDLEALRNYDSDCVLIVRKIKKLGFESPTALREHFGRYGEVADVRVAHSTVKPTAKRPGGRVRPAALGFVVMGSGDAARRAVEAGTEQMVCSTVVIEVAEFSEFEKSGNDSE